MKLCSLREQQLPFVEEKKESEDRLWSWGAGTDGQLGTGRLQDEHLPRLLSLPSVSTLACGGAHVIALTSGTYMSTLHLFFFSNSYSLLLYIKYFGWINAAGKVLSWGRGNSGQLGHGEIVNSMLYPKAVTSLDNYFITYVSAGWSHSGFVSGLDLCPPYMFVKWIFEFGFLLKADYFCLLSFHLFLVGF